MRRRFNLTLQYWKDGDWFVGQIVEVPAAISQGSTIAELQANIVDAYLLVTSELRRRSKRARSRPRAKFMPLVLPPDKVSVSAGNVESSFESFAVKGVFLSDQVEDTTFTTILRQIYLRLSLVTPR